MRVFTTASRLTEDTLQVESSIYHHLSRVLRIQKGETLIIVVDERYEWTVTFHYMKDQIIHFKKESVKTIEQSPLSVTVVQGLPKQDKMMNILDGLVQLGVRNILPVQMERSIVKWDASKCAKHEQRWREAIYGAAVQSKQNHVAQLQNIQTLAAFVDNFDLSDYDCCLVAWEDESQERHLKQILASSPTFKRVCIVVGPEGGISEQEIALLTSKGFKCFSLGKSILRVEIAAIVAMTQVSYESVN